MPYAGAAKIFRGENMARIERLVSYGCFQLETALLPLPPGQTGTCLLLFRDYASHITPVEILLVRQRDEGPPHIFVPVFSGFLLAETVMSVAIMKGDVAFMGQLVLTRPSGATAGDDGVRVLSEGTTLGTMATFTEASVGFSLGGGDDAQLLRALFGHETLDEDTESITVAVKRIDPKAYFPDGDTGRFFRYRPWG